MTTIAQETTTLPEGATVSLIKFKVTRAKGGIGEYVELRAWIGPDMVVMRVDNVGAYNLRAYLEMIVREINRQRTKLAEYVVTDAMLPMPVRHPSNFVEFVGNMAAYKMFILRPNYKEVLNDKQPRNERVGRARGKVSRNKRRKSHKQTPKRSGGNARGNHNATSENG